MVDTDIERLSRLMLDEFKRVHERFEAIDTRFDTLDAKLSDIETELRDIRGRLEALEEAAQNTAGFTKEIDHLLKRVVVIEKHLGLEAHIKA
jgi:predicted  nucleic acid-binding Zn-ribbon protein